MNCYNINISIQLCNITVDMGSLGVEHIECILCLIMLSVLHVCRISSRFLLQCMSSSGL